MVMMAMGYTTMILMQYTAMSSHAFIAQARLSDLSSENRHIRKELAVSTFAFAEAAAALELEKKEASFRNEFDRDVDENADGWGGMMRMFPRGAPRVSHPYWESA